MAEPARNRDSGIEPDIAPNLRAIQGGGESTSDRGNLRAVSDLESNPEAPRPNDSVADQENTPSNVIRGPWENNVSQGNIKSKVKGNIFKRKGPLGAIISGLVLGGFGITSIFTPATLLINLKENFVNKFDTQNTSMTVRMNKVITSKIVGETTSGVCTTMVKVACRFTRPSNNFLSKLSDNGITPMKDGVPIEKTRLGWPNDRPTSYEFIDKSGKPISATAKELSGKLADNAEFRAAFHKAFNPRWIGYTDSVATKVLNKFGASKKNSIKPDTTPQETTDTLNRESKAPSNSVSDAAATGAGDVAEATDKLIADAAEEEITAAAKKASKSAADPLILMGTVSCLALNTPGVITKFVRAYQMRQLISYGLVFMTVADAIKAGDATPEQVSTLGTILTKELVDSKGSVTSKSALDSFGIKNALFGDTSTTGNLKDYKNFIPGGSMMKETNGIVGFANNSSVRSSCSAITSPQAQVAATAIEAGIGASTAGIGEVAILALKAGGKVALQTGVITKVTDLVLNTGIVSKLIKLLPTTAIANVLLGDFTKNIESEDAGNALSSGVAHYMGQTANAGGNAPLTVSQALAYKQVTDSVNIAYAEEDRATLSPFDTSSPNTMVGSIVSQILPYYSELSSVSGSMSFFGNIVGRSFGNIFSKVSAASDPSAQYTSCIDANMGGDIAAGPFCNIIYGIPTENINKSTESVLNYLKEENQINEYSGDPIDGSKLANWVSECTGGTASGSSGCKLDDSKESNYNFGLYLIDHRIQKSLDAEDDSTATPTAAPATNTALPNGTDKELAQQIISSGKVNDTTGQLQQIIAGSRTNIFTGILQTIASLGVNNNFTISSMKRDSLLLGNSTSLHLLGRAVDISGSSGIDGVTFGYNGNSPVIQAFLDQAAATLPTNCQIGVPNQAYVNATQPKVKSGCNVFIDLGTGAHVHLGIK